MFSVFGFVYLKKFPKSGQLDEAYHRPLDATGALVFILVYFRPSKATFSNLELPTVYIAIYILSLIHI